MKYTVIETQHNADGTTGHILNDYTDKADAEERYHDVLRYAAKSQIMIHCCTMLNGNGGEIKHESYTHPVPVPEQPEEVEE